MAMTYLTDILILAGLAGLATGIGGAIAVIKRPGERIFGFLMGFAAGVMIALSFLGMVAEAWKSTGFLMTTLAFTIGAFLMFSLDILIPHIRFSVKETSLLKPELFTTGILIAIGITLHNIPEGISVGAGYLHSPGFGVLLAIAIALHNIPEGIATALPIYASGASRLSALKITLFSGLMEPVGALVAALFLTSFQSLIPVTLAFAAGVMIFITLDELIPTAHKYGHEHFTALGIITGTIFMFLLLGIFNI